jgi:hypothetical protein
LLQGSVSGPQAHGDSLLIIGIDCATDEGKVGLALADSSGREVSLLDVKVASRAQRASSIAADWLKDATEPALLALDAPLGWPAPMGKLLLNHEAGLLIREEANQLFRRETDRAIWRRLQKTPLDVGADRIARTAHAALRMLEDIRLELRMSIPLAWSPDFVGVAAIEVYPAATIRARGLSDKSYKRMEHADARGVLLDAFRNEMTLQCPSTLLATSADALDAAACVLAGTDFMRGVAIPPDDLDLAKKEGWIWAP